MQLYGIEIEFKYLQYRMLYGHFNTTYCDSTSQQAPYTQALDMPNGVPKANQSSAYLIVITGDR